MAICEKCGRDYGDASYKFCLDDGARLPYGSAEDTVLMPALPKRSWEDASDAEQEQYLLLKHLYSMDEFAFLKYDSRFLRLLERYRKKNYTECTNFIDRLIGRSELAASKNSENWDPRTVEEALASESDDESDKVFRKVGLI